MTPEAIDVQLTKLAPVAGQVVIVTIPSTAPYDGVLRMVQHINGVLPEGVSIAVLDSCCNVVLCNVPEFLAMLTKPEVTH